MPGRGLEPLQLAPQAPHACVSTIPPSRQKINCYIDILRIRFFVVSTFVGTLQDQNLPNFRRKFGPEETTLEVSEGPSSEVLRYAQDHPALIFQIS